MHHLSDRMSRSAGPTLPQEGRGNLSLRRQGTDRDGACFKNPSSEIIITSQSSSCKLKLGWRTRGPCNLLGCKNRGVERTGTPTKAWTFRAAAKKTSLHNTRASSAYSLTYTGKHDTRPDQTRPDQTISENSKIKTDQSSYRTIVNLSRDCFVASTRDVNGCVALFLDPGLQLWDERRGYVLRPSSYAMLPYLISYYTHELKRCRPR